MRPITHCINKQLADLCQKALKLEELSSKIIKFLPPEFAPYCQVTSFNRGVLHLSTVNAAWATQLRFVVGELRDKLRKEAGLYQLSSIKIGVIEPAGQLSTDEISTKKYTLSAEVKELVLNESQKYAYEPLKKAL